MSGIYTHLSSEERAQIGILKKNGYSFRRIGKELGRSPSTISREVKRNQGEKGYRPLQAQDFAERRRSSASQRTPKISGELKARIDQDLRETQFSPEQISGRLKREGGSLQISSTAIYEYIEQDKRFGGSLWQHLRHGGKNISEGRVKHLVEESFLIEWILISVQL